MSRRKQREKPSSPARGKGGRDETAIEGGLWQRLWNLNALFRESRDADKLLKAALRLSLDHFAADVGCLVRVPPGSDVAELLYSTGKGVAWDPNLLGGFLRGYDVPLPREMMAARIRRHGRVWGALVLQSTADQFDWKSRQALSVVGSASGYLLEIMDRERAREVRARIDREILAQRKPKDLFYKLLHGIRSLTAYDHSSSLFTFNEAGTELELMAEQIAWRKSKSQRIGHKIPVPEVHREKVAREEVLVFDRKSGKWHDRLGGKESEFALLFDLDGEGGQEEGQAKVGCMLCAPLVTTEGPVGVLKIASLHESSLGDYESELIARFLPQAAVIIRNMKRTETLEMQVLQAERKNAMADLARGVSHDVNNALGAVLPLVQQLREDIEIGELDPAVAREDLTEIERSLQVCRRIFGGMLGFARHATRNASEVHLQHAVETTLGILREGIQKRGIQVELSVPADLPGLWVVQADIEQLLLNLLGNARDAMKAGDKLTISALSSEYAIELVVEDTGIGISPADLPKVQEPFFTTKPTGNGLGLAICRSIVAEMRGRLAIESVKGVGTRVRVNIPIIKERMS